MSRRRSSKPAQLTELIIPGLATGYAVYYVASVRDFPFEAQLTGFALGALLVGLCAIFFTAFAVRTVRAGTASSFGDLLGTGFLGWQRWIFAALTVLSVLAIPWAGFTLTTFVFLFGSFLLLGARPVRRAAAVAGCAAIAGWLFFVVLLGTRFPPGPFERLVDWII